MIGYCKPYLTSVSKRCFYNDGIQQWTALYTDKKENKIFLIFKEIQKGAVAKSYM